MAAAPSDLAAARAAAPLDARAAIVHDWFQGFHGSERVVDAMLPMFAAQPDVFTFSAARELLPDRLAQAIVRDSRLSRLPGVRQRAFDPGRWRFLLPYMPTYFERLPLRGYDVVISSSHACAVGAHPRDDALHVCYCHTPMRYVWVPDADAQRAAGPAALGLRAFRGHLRRWDRRAAQRPDLYIANSSAVAERIEHAYGRESVVVHPPVALGDFDPATVKEEDHFLWVHRLVPYKRPLEVARAFAALPELRLTMVGVGPLQDRLRAELPTNVTLRGWVKRAELGDLFARAAGFIHVGEEDFGITMVEALAAGTPVLALARGGARDIIENGRTGVLVDHATNATIAEGARALAGCSWDPRVLRQAAEQFSEERFRERMTAILCGHGVG